MLEFGVMSRFRIVVILLPLLLTAWKVYVIFGLYWLLAISVLSVVSIKFNKSILVTILLFVVGVVTIIYLGQILAPGPLIDTERLYFVNYGYGKQIGELQRQALYLPFKVRGLVFSWWYLIVDLAGKAWYAILPTKAVGLVGWPVLIISWWGLFWGKINKSRLLVFCLLTATSALHRNPNPNFLYLTLLPILLSAYWSQASKMSIKNLLIIIISTTWLGL